MKVDLGDLNAFVAVARAKGFREGARASGASASSLSEAVRRLEADLGVRLLNRTTRSVAPTEAGERLLARLGSALTEVEAALDGVNGSARPARRHAAAQRPGQRVAADAAAHRAAVPRRLSRHHAGGDRRRQFRRRAGGRLRRRHPLRRAAGAGHDRRADRAARPALRHRRRARLSRSPRPARAPARTARPRLPARPLRQRATPAWEFERDGEIVRVDPSGPLLVRLGGGSDLLVDAAIAGVGIIHHFEDWLRPHLDSGALEPILEALVAEFLRAVPLLSRPPPRARAAAGVRRLRQGVARRGLS